MTSSHLHYGHYTGALYPLDLHAEPSLHQKQTLRSLLDICAAYIVQDSTLTSNAAQVVPQEIFVPLMRAALLGNKDRAVEALLYHWPYATLSLKTLVPSLFTSVLPLYDTDYLSDIVRNSLRYTTCLAHTFLEGLKNKSPSKLRYLDISGFPTGKYARLDLDDISQD